MDYSNYFSPTTLAMKASMIRELLASTRGIEGLISFAGGFPNPSTFPTEQLAAIYEEVVRTEGKQVCQYGSTDGDPQLKDALIKIEKNVTLTKDEIITGVGSTNAIYAYARTMIEPGDYVICEGPSFLGVLVGFEACGAKLIGIDVDDDGMNMEMLEAKIKEIKAKNGKIKFIYTIPEFQNPTGVSMSLAKKQQLIELSEKYQLPILEDNPYGPLRYTGEATATVFEIARSKGLNNVTCVKSFSKVLGPGMRCGYMMADKQVIGKVESWLQKIITCGDGVTARVIAKFLDRGLLPKQLEKIAAIYQPSMQAMLDALEEYMPEGITWTKPEGGMFLWVHLPEGMSGDDLFEKAKAEKLCFIPGSKFYPTGQEKYNALRLNYTYADVDTIKEGIQRLAKLI